MATGPLTAAPQTRVGALVERGARGTAAPPVAPSLVAIALLILVLYAAFDHGAVALSVDTRIEVALAAIAALAAGAWLALGTLRFSASRSVVAGTALLAALACWCGVTVLWSVAPDQTWIELNRALAYVIVLCLAVAVGASYERGVPLVANGFLAIALAVTLYALGQKLFPGLRVPGLFNLNQTEQIPRLQEPLGYWNALALLVAMAVPIALARATDSTRSRPGRLAAGCVTQLMLLTIGLTFSRGGLIALALAVAVAVAAAPNRLRSLLWLAAAVVATIPPLAFGLASHTLTTAGASLPSREGAGAVLAGILLASLAGLVAAGRRLLMVEGRLHIAPATARAIRRAAPGAVLALLLCAAVTLALTGTISHAWNGFISTRQISNYNPNRLLTTASNRWVWWKEAADAFSARPAGGWGAGSFGVVHLLYRRNTLPVQQPHSVPLQFLAETGVIGALLGLAAFAFLMYAAAVSVRRFRPGPERALAAGLLGAAAAYAVHSLYDWDWNIPAVTLPALLFIGVLVGSRHPRRQPQIDAPGRGARVAALVGITVWLCAFALSAVLPSLASSEASSAMVAASSTAPGALSAAQSSAALATSLDPLADAGLRAEATIAVHRTQLSRAREYLREAVAREPSDGLAWTELAQVDGFLGNSSEAALAGRRVIALDPQSQAARSLERALGARK
jgi:hypothetical protein